MTDQPLSYWMAVARMGFEDDFHRIFDELGISRAELAEKLGTTPAYVSKLLNGRAGNFQLETMAKMARAIGAILQIRLIKGEGEVVRVVDYETARELDSAQETASADGSTGDAMASILPFRGAVPARSSPLRVVSYG